jgi:hypothetical protein
MEAICSVQPELELGMLVDYDELFALRERIRSYADQIRARLYMAGLRDELETEVFDQEVELRGTGKNPLLIRLDPFRLEITGCRPSLPIHKLAALLLEEAGVFRIASVEASFQAYLRPGPGRPLNLIDLAFGALNESGETRLDRRFSLTWEWGNATTGYSLTASSTEDQELFVGYKVRDSYMTLLQLQGDEWFAQQMTGFEENLANLLARIGWRG